MVTLGDIEQSIENLKKASGSDFDIEGLYSCISSILCEYSKRNPEYLNPNSSYYEFLYNFFGIEDEFADIIRYDSEIYFPMFMENIDRKYVDNFIEIVFNYLTDDINFVSEIKNVFSQYDFISSNKNNMFKFIENEFKNIVGLTNIKEDLKDLVILITNNMIREKNELNKTSISMHMVFTGNPGTGKTTIARLIGEIYHKFGLIKSNKFLEVSRVDLVGEYVGQTAPKTLNVLEESRNGILFIDEAYSLSNSSDNDYGKEAVDTILKFMEDNRDDTIIIVAGYENEMNTFINSNPGLKSRFNKFFKFNNYTGDELFEIFNKFVQKDGYIIDTQEKEIIKNKFRNIDTTVDNFSNARFVRNVYEKTILNQVKRIDASGITDKTEFVTIKNSDIVL